MAPGKRKGLHVKGSPKTKGPAEIVERYIACINAGDSTGLAAVAGTAPRFVDATGAEYRLTSEAWAGFFEEFPDYRIEVDQILSKGDLVAVFGSASGSFHGVGNSKPGAAWSFPAAWRAIVRNGKLLEWQVYGDIEPMMKSAGRARSN